MVDRNENVGQELVNSTEKLKRSFKFLQDQINDLSLQISQIENITRLLPSWIEKINQLKNNVLIPNLDGISLLNLCSDLEEFIRRSASGNLGSIFFGKLFDKLSSVNEKRIEIRMSLRDLQTDISEISKISSKDSESLQRNLSKLLLY